MKKAIMLPLLLASTLATPAAAQLQRVYVGPTPTNVQVDWSLGVAVPDATLPDTFLLLLPIGQLDQWARWDPDAAVDSFFGAGNWLRCRMTAVQWAYLSPDTCAHQPAAGNAAPLSLLTTSYDFGAYWGSPGTPLLPGATLFNQNMISTIDGSSHPWIPEWWQLRSSAFFFEPWNACPNGLPYAPNFTGWLAVRFSYQFL